MQVALYFLQATGQQKYRICTDIGTFTIKHKMQTSQMHLPLVHLHHLVQLKLEPASDTKMENYLDRNIQQVAFV